MTEVYNGPERRQFMRIDYAAPLAFKICRKETLSKILEGYTSDVSQSGLMCSIKEKVNHDDILWLAFDRAVLNICEELEKKSLIYQNGIVGKVVRIESKEDSTYEVGIQFITREEKSIDNIFPKEYFLGESK